MPSQNCVLSQTGISGALQCQLYGLEALGRAWSEMGGTAVLLEVAEAAVSQEQESKARWRQTIPALVAPCFHDGSRSQLLPNHCRPCKTPPSMVVPGRAAAPNSPELSHCTLSTVLCEHRSSDVTRTSRANNIRFSEIC